jgi:pilus assembly protein CpaB
MKKINPILVFGLAALFGILAVFVANRWLSSQMIVPEIAREEASPQLAKVVIAARQIGVGTPLTSQNLVLADWPRANVPQGAFQNIEEVEGRVAVSRISAGVPLLASELAAPGSGAGLVAAIPQGTRAMSIRVDEVIGVSGFVLPHTYVDVIGVEGDNRQQTAKTILRRIKVLAVAQETFNDEGTAKVVRTVTLQVKPAESELLALQTHRGSIHLVLRNPLEEVEVEVAKKEEKPEIKVAAAPRPRVPVILPSIKTVTPSQHAVEIIRGSKREEVKFEGADL